MLQIDFVERESSKNGTISGHIIVNSIEDKRSYYYELIEDYKLARINNNLIVDELLKHSFEDIGAFLYKFSYNIKINEWDFWVDFEIICKPDSEKLAPSIEARLNIETERWKKPYSISDFSQELQKIIEADNDTSYKYFQDDEAFASNGFGIRFPFSDSKIIINTIVDEVIIKLKEILARTNKNVISNLDKESLITFFLFPENIKVTCQQYLIYFAQFLADIGINVDTEIKDGAYGTLFKVVPRNTNDSLQKIKDALQVYLNAADIDTSTNIDNDLAVLQWQANIVHLKSQLIFANSALQLKETVIQSLQLSNYQYQQLLNEKTREKETDKEEDIIKGILSLKKYEGSGFTVNFAEILRRLKRRFR